MLEPLKCIISIGIIILLLKIKCSYSNTTGPSGPCALVEYGNKETLCIPFEEINKAFDESRLKVNLFHPFPVDLDLKKFHNHDAIDQLGHALTETTRILAIKYDLDNEAIRVLLPQLDLHFTNIWEFCPSHFRPKKCLESPYRSLSGHCNNFKHPHWGATLNPFRNILPAHRPDGISGARDEERSLDLPNPRVVSNHIHRDAVLHDHSITIMLIAWGQIIDHDITLTGDTKDLKTFKEPECCIGDIGHHHHNCKPIRIPINDPFYKTYNHRCMNFARSLAGVRAECRLGPRVAFNTISSFLDASFVYGSNPEFGRSLREGKYGLLRSHDGFREYDLKHLLPLKLNEPDDGCIRPNGEVYCFEAGDIRVNEQLVLTVLHTIFMREHNRIAKILMHINLHWDDERIFQETRRIIIALVQQITYDEFLPLVLGRELMHSYGINLNEHGHWDGYDDRVDPSAAEEFITSAFRFGHSLLPTKIERWTTTHKYIDSENLSNLLRQPFHLFKPGYIDNFVAGLTNQLAQAMDEGVTEEVTNMLFKEPNKHFGMDLAAMNIQRGREHGVPGYAHYRKICGLQPIYDWDDLYGVMRNETIYKYKSLYKSPLDIDLWSGGVSEISGKGSLLGPTFGCILGIQFKNLRYGDRFWFELPHQLSSFTEDQLHEIRHMKLSRLLCDNTDSIKSIQINAMLYPDPHRNPRVSCESQIIHHLDLEAWRENKAVHSYEDHDYTDNNNDIHDAHVSFNHHDLNHLDVDNGHHGHLISNDDNDDDDYYSDEEIDEQHHIGTSEYAKNVKVVTPLSLPQPKQQRRRRPKYLHNKHIPKMPSNFHSLPPPPRPVVEEFIEKERVHGQKIAVLGRQGKRPRRVIARKHKTFVPSFPQSGPFPGMDGIFSPNPGYLVRQKFQLYQKPVPPPGPAYLPLGSSSKPNIWAKLFG